jgi:hypothetical protein
MDVSELRKRILRALDEGRRDAVVRRAAHDEAARAYEQFLEGIALPLLRQAQQILKAENQSFTMRAPAGSAGLVSDASPDTYLEFVLDTAGDRPQVVGRLSLARGRGRVDVDERPIVPNRPIADLTEEDVAAFLVAQVPRLVARI